MADNDFRRSPCAIANILDIIGDKWTLLVIRDLYLGKTTFTELQDSIEKIPSNILAQRLKLLLSHDIIDKQQYQSRPKRYAYLLTKKGSELDNILKAMLRWGNKYIAGTFTEQQIKDFREKIEQNKCQKSE